MDKHTASRRQLLKVASYGAGAAIVAGGAALAGEARSATVDRSAWDVAMARYQAADAASRADDKRFSAIHAAWEASRPSLDTIDWKFFVFADRRHIAFHADIDEMEQKHLSGEGKWWWGGKERHVAAFQSVRDFRERNRQHDRAHGINEASDRNDALGEQSSLALDVLIEMPAPDAAALAWKLRYLLEAEDDEGCTPAWAHFYIRPVLADLSRFAGEAA